MILYGAQGHHGARCKGYDRIWSLPGREPTPLSGFAIVPRCIVRKREIERVHSRHPAGTPLCPFPSVLHHSIAWAPALQLWPTILMMATTQVLPLPSLFEPPFLAVLSLLSPSPPSSTRPTGSLSQVLAFLLTLCREASLLSLTATDFLDGTPSFSRASLSFTPLDLYFASLGVDRIQ